MNSGTPRVITHHHQRIWYSLSRLFHTPLTGTAKTLAISTRSRFSAARLLSTASGTEPSAAPAPAEDSLKKTALYDKHVERGGRMVPFAGHWLPLMYTGPHGGIKAEHLHVRRSAGVFDVSHMGQVRVYGKDRVRFLERLVVADVAALGAGHATLSLLTTEHGGIIDDTIVTNLGRDAGGRECLGMVINGACVDKDMAHMQQQAELARREQSLDVELQLLGDRSLLALQGPQAMTVLQRLLPASAVDLKQVPFMTAVSTRPPSFTHDALISRCGYTGEDGFEVSVHNADAPAFFEALLDHTEVVPCGLGARDSLRLEAGLCLYGNDIDENKTPVQAALTWTVAKSRRNPNADPGRVSFLGAEMILREVADPSLVPQRRVGFTLEGGPPARGHEPIFAAEGDGSPGEGKAVGEVTSGGFSPSLNTAIGMGYVAKAFSKAGTPIYVLVRGKKVPGKVAKMPLVPTHYYKP
ncbi:hypothetical protein CDCA_CDCA14G3868 [Cyanidium caldarium]|uniref:Aminomethyltransferase n=1 Tax=Cyanidium caldarium TaxID=2771 RepID=A0AAV9J1E1_CYACA|nr:hypothetical protein CDCA_CDCA14G3868 [Cyanidium caldarium]